MWISFLLFVFVFFKQLNSLMFQNIFFLYYYKKRERWEKSDLLFLLDNMVLQWKHRNLLLKTILLWIFFSCISVTLWSSKWSKKWKAYNSLEYIQKLPYRKLIWPGKEEGQSLLYLPYRFSGINTGKLKEIAAHWSVKQVSYSVSGRKK